MSLDVEVPCTWCHHLGPHQELETDRPDEVLALECGACWTPFEVPLEQAAAAAEGVDR